MTGKAPVIVEPWTQDPRVRVLSFTGSTEVGRLLYRQCADTVKTLIMELGGHAPVMVFKDTDLEQAVEESIKAKFATSGQDCLGANRIFVERPVYDAFVEKFTEATRKMTLGIGMDDPDMGPLMNEKAVAKQEEHVADALAKGARLVCGGKRHALGPLFYEPTVLADVPADALILREETFGPVAAIVPFDTEEEVIARANDTEYGLVAYVHTRRSPADLPAGKGAAIRHGRGEPDQGHRCADPVRRHEAVGARARRRAAGPRGIHRDQVRLPRLGLMQQRGREPRIFVRKFLAERREIF